MQRSPLLQPQWILARYGISIGWIHITSVLCDQSGPLSVSSCCKARIGAAPHQWWLLQWLLLLPWACGMHATLPLYTAHWSHKPGVVEVRFAEPAACRLTSPQALRCNHTRRAPINTLHELKSGTALSINAPVCHHKLSQPFRAERRSAAVFCYMCLLWLLCGNEGDSATAAAKFRRLAAGAAAAESAQSCMAGAAPLLLLL